jgi:hypothetical protein
MTTSLINALLEERRGYMSRGKLERVQDVDKELARLGYSSPVPPSAVDSAPGRVDTTPAKKKPARKKV